MGGYDGTNKFFYVNGVLIGSKPVAFGPNDEDVLRFGGGATESDGNYFFEGDVDEVSFYAKALSQAQIVQHFVAGRPLQTGPSIDIGLANNKITLTWSSGTLQQTTDVTGTWQDVPAAASPFTVTPTGAHQFYRLKL